MFDPKRILIKCSEWFDKGIYSQCITTAKRIDLSLHPRNNDAAEVPHLRSHHPHYYGVESLEPGNPKARATQRVIGRS